MPFKVKKEELFTIPNILCYIRFLLIPVFAFVYLKGTEPKDFYIAGAILIVASLTDALDGFIARTFNMGSEWGKMIDPIIDKMMQVVVALCLCQRHPLMWAVVALLVVKEGYMGYKGWRNLKSGGAVKPALWFGKVCTAILFASFVALVMFDSMPMWASQVIIILDIIVMLFSFWMYVVTFKRIEVEARIKARKLRREEAVKEDKAKGATEDKTKGSATDKKIDEVDKTGEDITEEVDKPEDKLDNKVAEINSDFAKSIAQFNKTLADGKDE